MTALELLTGGEVAPWRILTGTTVAIGLRYLVFAGAAWVAGYLLFHRRWFHRKIIARFPAGADIRREMMYSLVSVVIFGLVGTGTFLAARAGWTRMYLDLGEHGVGWFLGTVVAAILLHDAYFYWTHRLMHHRRLFRFFHRVHHESTNPSPWTSYSFAPAEAVVQAMIFPVVALLVPIHPLGIGLFMLWQIVFNVAGHTGYEFNPRGFMESWLSRFLNTPTNHVMHHEKPRGNYGLYFNFWDRLMGTNHPQYEERFREVTSREREA